MRRRLKKSDEAEVNLTPMLDVVFIMLIFFIVTASFVKEKGLDLNRPSKSNVEQPDDPKRKSVVINITDRNQIWIQKRPIDLRSVKANVARLLAENPGAGVVIRANPESANGVMVEVMDQAKLGGASAIALTEGTM